MPLPITQSPLPPLPLRICLVNRKYQTLDCCITGFSFAAKGDAIMKAKKNFMVSWTCCFKSSIFSHCFRLFFGGMSCNI